jgi:hypothetical protein
VSVEKYRAYTELMEKNGGDDVASAFQFNAAIMKMVFGISEREVLKADVAEQLAAAKMIHFVMQDIITQKFLELNPNRPEEVEKEKSAFDEYDEENGYNEAENQLDDENIWKVCRDNTDRVVKLCIKGLNDSLSNVMKSDIMSLLDHVAFEIKTINEK